GGPRRTRAAQVSWADLPTSGLLGGDVVARRHRHSRYSARRRSSTRGTPTRRRSDGVPGSDAEELKTGTLARDRQRAGRDRGRVHDRRRGAAVRREQVEYRLEVVDG